MLKDKKTLANDILFNLEKASRIRKEYVTNFELGKIKQKLKTYQVTRLRLTHAEFLNNPDTRDATNFFLTEIYSDKDLTYRDKDLAKVVPMMCKLFPAELLSILSDAIELDALTEELDRIMCANLTVDFTDEEYKHIYAHKTSFEARKRQIELTETLGKSLTEVVKYPLIGGMLGKMSPLAKFMGLSDTHKLLYNGFHIFKNTKNVELFLNTLIRHEYAILEDIYETSL